MTGYESKRAAAQDKLAQPAQEPLACIGTNGELMWLNKPRAIYSKPIPLYTTPPQPAQEPVGVVALDTSRPFVSGSYNGQVMPWSQAPAVKTVVMFKDLPLNAPIYATPPQRTWVDLTDEEIGELIIGTLSADTNPAQTRPRDIKFARSVLATFKEKNT